MNWHSGELFRYDLPLIQPVVTGGVINTRRQGLLLRLKTVDGREGVGEIAPLPGLKADPAAATQFGFQMAQRSIAHFDAKGAVPLAALIEASGKEAVTIAQQRVIEGFQTIKLKVGRAAIADEIKMVREVRIAVGKNVRIRLDANGSWDFFAAVEFGKAVERVGIEFIEEPVKELVRLGDFFAQTGLPIALDESLRGSPVIPENGLVAFVLKPTLLGNRTFELAQFAHAHGIKCIISGCYESSVAALAMAQLHGELNPDSDTACGLSTFMWFKEDILSPPLRPFRGSILLGEPRRVLWDKLEKQVETPFSARFSCHLA